MDNGRLTGANGIKVTYQQATITGTVQGVGFRPFVCRTATQTGVHGSVCNIGSAVRITAMGESKLLKSFWSTIASISLQGAVISDFLIEDIAAFEVCGFTIIDSVDDHSLRGSMTADLPICKSCIQELSDITNRRFGHALISCASCGPRFTILEAIPYDRHNTVMKTFAMCHSCAAEYSNSEDIRYHAQTISCHNCGPEVFFRYGGSDYNGEAAISKSAELLLSGQVVAIKGIGGYHAACLPTSGSAVATLRSLKGREKKPFAVMFLDIEEIEAFCEVSEAEKQQLLSEVRPIVLLNGLNDSFAYAVSGDSLQTGCFLAYTPMQILLLRQTGALVMTSLNRSESPIIYDDNDAFSFPRIDGVLFHNRKILRPLDDSVVSCSFYKPRVIRRGRGLVPQVIELAAQKQILAMGGDLKAALCIVNKSKALLSAPHGDLASAEAANEYSRQLSEMLKLTNSQPELVVCDTHPLYKSAEIARSFGVPVLSVQHHHAHVAAVMAEFGLQGEVIGIAFDGTGYGLDGTVWGGEVLLCNQADFTRVGHLPKVKMLGGDHSAKDAQKALDCYLHSKKLPQYTVQGELLKKALDNNINTIFSTSAGRLFDAVSAFLGVCKYNEYEGQCAMTLERTATAAKRQGIEPYTLTIENLWNELVAAKIENAGALALGFHYALAEWILKQCSDNSKKTYRVVLSGGVFQNSLLTELTETLLRKNGFQVYFAERFPSGDGALALGQAYIAALLSK